MLTLKQTEALASLKNLAKSLNNLPPNASPLVFSSAKKLFSMHYTALYPGKPIPDPQNTIDMNRLIFNIHKNYRKEHYNANIN